MRLLVLLAGCTPASDKVGDTGDSHDSNGVEDTADTTDSAETADSTDTAETAETAETGDSTEDTAFGEATARLSTGTSTVVIVDWTGGTADDWVEFGPDASYGSRAPARAPGEAILLGNHASTTVHYRVGAVVEGETVYTADQTITTGTIPPSVPMAATERNGDDAWGSWILTSYFSTATGDAGLVIFDADGEVVWYHETDPGWVPADRPTLDGTGVQWLWTHDVIDISTAEVCTIDMDGETTSCVPTPYAHHDFVPMDDGSVVYLQSTEQDWHGDPLLGDLLQQRAPDGTVTTLWNSFDDITPVPTADWQVGPTGAIDWTHCNGLWRDPANGDWIISSYLLLDIRRVSASTGQSTWVLGGDENDFDFDGSRFGPQHAPRLVDGGILLFDNTHSNGPSRVVRYDLDETAFTATEVYSEDHPNAAHSPSMGAVDLTANGYVAAGFGAIGDIAIYDADGAVVVWWDAPIATATGEVHLQTDLYALRE